MGFLRNRYLRPQRQIGSCFSSNGDLRTEWRPEFFLPFRSTPLQCPLNTTNDLFANSARIAKAYFAFCRVNIYIDSRWIQLQKDERNRIVPFHESGMVTFTHSGSDKATFDRATVYKDELLRLCLAAQTCLPNKATDSTLPRGSTVYLNKALQ